MGERGVIRLQNGLNRINRGKYIIMFSVCLGRMEICSKSKSCLFNFLGGEWGVICLQNGLNRINRGK